MQQFQQIKQWYFSLPQKEQWLLLGTSAFVALTLFYVTIWEPLNLGLEAEQQRLHSQQETLLWMQQAASEVRVLRNSGKRNTVRDHNKAITLVIEQTVNTAGMKPSVEKIESSGKGGARVSLREASFNQMLVWLETLATHYAIHVSSANIERSDKPGRVNARLSFERN